MWVEQTKDGQFKFIERYVDPYTEKTRKKSTTLTSNSPQAWKKAQKILDKKLKKHSKITINQISLLVSCIKNGMNIISSMSNVLAF